MGDAKPFLELTSVRRSFGDIAVLQGLSLQVDRGEFVTILGPSGSGKSTTLNLIAGFDSPGAGSITLAGRDITHAPPYARGIGMVFQNYALFPHMTVVENVAFPLRVRRCREAEVSGRVARALDVVQMGGFGERYPAQLSGGQAQRIAIARAIVYSPDLLLMDEPLGALDRKLRTEMQFELKRLHRDLGMTIVYVTHDQEEALTMSDRIAVLDGGALVQCGSPQEIYERPKSAFIARFVGETNFVDAQALVREGRLVAWCDILGLEIPLDGSSEWSTKQRLTLSIRPEHIRLSLPSHSTISAHVRDVQYLGDAVRCRLQHGEVMLTGKLPADTDPLLLRPGTAVEVSIDRSKASVFAATHASVRNVA